MDDVISAEEDSGALLTRGATLLLLLRGAIRQPRSVKNGPRRNMLEIHKAIPNLLLLPLALCSQLAQGKTKRDGREDVRWTRNNF